MPSSKILVIENDRQVATELRSRLIRLGYEIVGTAASRDEALQLSLHLKPELILSNTRLSSVNDGIQTGKLIHTKHNTPVVYITTQSSQNTIRQASSTGPFGYIIKPFDDLQLFATIEIALTRYRLENQLAENRQWLNGVLMSIGEGVIAVDKNGAIQFINLVAEKLTGWENSLAIDKKLYNIFDIRDEKSGEILDLSNTLILNRSKGKGTHAIEALLVTRESKYIPVEIILNPIFDHADSFQGLVISFRDMTANREATEQIKQQANRAEALVQITKQLNSLFDLKEVLTAVCKATNKILHSSASIIFLYNKKTDSFNEIAHQLEDDIPLAKQYPASVNFSREILEKYLVNNTSAIAVYNVYKLREVPYRGALRLLKIKRMAVVPIARNSELAGILICGSKVDREYSEQDLAFLTTLAEHIMIAITNTRLFENVRQGRERQRLLSKSVVGIQESERRRIARELHDHLGQELTGIQFVLESIKGRLDESVRSDIEELQGNVTGIISRIREISLNLRPSMLDDLGLVPTLKWHIDRFSHQTGIRVNFNSSNVSGRFSEEIEITAYRIIQEALTNIARHSNAKEVIVGLSIDERALWLEVLDKGRGFDTSVTFSNSTSGLSGMTERATLAGGQLSINSYINQGTQIIATLPIGNLPIEKRKNDRNDLAS